MLDVDRQELLSSSIEETQAFGHQLASHLAQGDILCLQGDLGAGKTTLCKSLISSLTGISKESIQSPTFTYLQLYETPFFSICHFDLYRLNSSEDFVNLGFLDYFDKSYLCLIEWPCKIADLIPKSALQLTLSHITQTQRKLCLGRWGDVPCL